VLPKKYLGAGGEPRLQLVPPLLIGRYPPSPHADGGGKIRATLSARSAPLGAGSRGSLDFGARAFNAFFLGAYEPEHHGRQSASRAARSRGIAETLKRKTARAG
jgi:hypothetical protein